MKETNVTINVTLDENNIPEKIIWSAPDGGVSDFPAKAMLLSLWDSNNKESLKMDLWVKDMPVEEMKNFIFQTFMSMKNTVQKSTSDQNLTNLVDDFSLINDAALNAKKQQKISEWVAEKIKITYIRFDYDYNNCDVLKKWKK